jgi:hypothetical protein
VITILGIATAQVALVCVWRLVAMVRRGTVFSHAAFGYVDVIIGAIVAAALVWFAVTALNAPGQRDDPGVTLIMGGIGVAILGGALIVLVLRMLLAQAVARDVEATSGCGSAPKTSEIEVAGRSAGRSRGLNGAPHEGQVKSQPR